VADLVRRRGAPGAPGLEPRWTPSAKDGIGTAYSTQSKIWFTTASGIVTEVYYPTIDRPQVRDLQLLVTDGRSFFHDERGYLVTEVREIEPHALGLEIVNRDPEHRYRIVKELITDPHQACLLVHGRLERAADHDGELRVFVLCAPHLEVGGWNNSGYVASRAGREFLVAHKGSTWLALAADRPFRKRSVGFVGTSDGWQDLSGNYEMDWEYDHAESGNIALTAELDLGPNGEFTLGLAFGDHLHHATSTVFQSVGVSFEHHKARFIEQWHRPCEKLLPLHGHSADGGRLYRRSHSYLIAHEDKTYPGAIIASLSIPWGESKGDEELGGYHLVWTRDLVNSALGLLAAGDSWTPLRALIYLACTQHADGGFPQNSWINGESYWQGVQLDEVAFPILLACRLDLEGALRDFDPRDLIVRASGYLVRNGPVTQQERWEENSGYSPSTLASNIAALVAAADFLRRRDDAETARFLEEYADFLESRVERWTVTNAGTLVPGISRHYIRILPSDPQSPHGPPDPDLAIVKLKNRPPGKRDEYPAKEIVDAGFLELVRYGIRKPGDPLVEDSLKVIDAALGVDLPQGRSWHRYTHDGYGETEDGGPYRGHGRGRAWPLLTGERAHYELACGRDVKDYVRALERFATRGRLLSEQLWDEASLPARGLELGRPTGAAMPLMWAHAEYIKLLRSIADGRIFDLVPSVASRYSASRSRSSLKVWKLIRQPKVVRAGSTLRVIVPEPFLLRSSKDGWATANDVRSRPTKLDLEYVDVPIDASERAPVRFTFLWTRTGKWAGRDYQVEIQH
jgi:glucoamylase